MRFGPSFAVGIVVGAIVVLFLVFLLGEDNSASLGPGVAAGLIVGMVCLAFKPIWERIIVPWYEEKVYHDAKIEGQWKATLDMEGIKTGETINLIRKGHDVALTISRTSGSDEGRTYLASGTFRNLILTGTYAASQRAFLDRGSFSLMLVNNGNTLRGHCSYYSDRAHFVEPANYEWNKVS
jgi:hypothetical protein